MKLKLFTAAFFIMIASSGSAFALDDDMIRDACNGKPNSAFPDGLSCESWGGANSDIKTCKLRTASCGGRTLTCWRGEVINDSSFQDWCGFCSEEEEILYYDTEEVERLLKDPVGNKPRIDSMCEQNPQIKYCKGSEDAAQESRWQ